MMKTRIWIVMFLILALVPVWARGAKNNNSIDGVFNISVTALHWAPHPLPAEDSMIPETK